MKYRELLGFFFNCEVTTDTGLSPKDQILLRTFKRRFSGECIDSMRFQYGFYQSICKKAGINLTSSIKEYCQENGLPNPAEPIEWLALACLFMLSLNINHIDESQALSELDTFVDEFGIIDKHGLG